MVTDSLQDVSIEQLRRRSSFKWRAFPDDVLPAFVAEMDFPPAPVVAAAIRDAVASGDCGYAWPSEEFGRAMAAFYDSRFGWIIDPSDVVIVPDIMTGATEILRRATTPGDEVVINTPVYPPFFSRIAEAGCRVVEAPLVQRPGGNELDLEAVERAFANGARVYLLCNPHNPTGRVFSRLELEHVADLAERYGVLVLSDEVHAPLALPGARHIPYLTLSDKSSAHGIALVSASKAWNIPGLKCAQIVAGSNPMRDRLGKMPPDMVLRSGHVGVIASTAAYAEGGEWLDRVLSALDENRHLLSKLLHDMLPGARYVPPQAGYLAWIDCRELGLDQEPVDVFLERGRVALGRGPDFGSPGIGHVRITTATSAAILREIVERMGVAIGYEASL